jgi:hypothetical protein
VVPAKQETGAVLIALGLGCCPLLHTKQNWRMQAYGPFSLPKLISVGPGWTGPTAHVCEFSFFFFDVFFLVFCIYSTDADMSQVASSWQVKQTQA